MFTLDRSSWGVLCVILTAWGWGCCTFPKQVKTPSRLATWQSRFWYLGLVLSTIGYLCFWPGWQNLLNFDSDIWWRLAWLTIPGLATLIAARTTKISRRRQATIFSIGSLILGQFLILGRPETRLIALGIGLWLMYFNAFHFRRRIITIIHLGFGLSMIFGLFACLTSRGILNNWHWLSIASLSLLGLYRLRAQLIQFHENPRFDYISQRAAHGILGVGIETANFKLIRHYVKAIDFWAIVLIIGQLSVLLSVGLFRWADSSGYLAYGITIMVLPMAIIWRHSQKFSR